MDPSTSRDPNAVCDALRATATQRPTPDRVKRVEAHRRSRSESVQSVAAQVLAGWRSNASLPALRELFDALARRPGSHALRGVVARAMGKVLRASDTPDIVAWFLSLPTYNARFELLPTVARVRPKRATPLLEAAWATANRPLKHSILVAASEMRVPELFDLGLGDRDAYIRELAESFAGQRDSVEWLRKWGDFMEGR